MPYTPGQVSEMLDIPVSSLRRLSAEFADFLTKTKGRHRRYTEQDIDILRRVREGTQHGQTIAQIKQELAIVPESPADQDKPGDSLMMVPAIAGELSRLDDSDRVIMQQLQQLRADHESDHERLQRLEAWLRLPWWKRLFTPPPQ